MRSNNMTLSSIYHAHQGLLAHLAALCSVIFWSSSFIVIRVGVQHYSPGSFALLRFLVASLCILILYRQLKIKSQISIKMKLQIMLFGMLGIGIYNIMLNHGEASVDATSAGFIISQVPIITAVLAMIFLREYIKPLGVVGVLLSIVGITLIITAHGNNGFHLSMGMIEIMIAMLAGGICSVWQKPLLKIIHPLEFTAYVIWGGTLLLLVYMPNLLHELPSVKLSVITWTVYLGIFPAAIAYLLWSYANSKLPVTKVASYMYLMPAMVMLLSWLLLNELPPLIAMVGGVVAFIGTVLLLL